MPDCTTCHPINTCRENLDRYSLQDDNYLFVLNCPPGAFCEGIGTVSLICCDGTELRVDLPEHILAAERTKIIEAMVEEAIRKLPFCDEPPAPPTTPCPSILDCPPTPIVGDGVGGGGGVDGTSGDTTPIQYYYSGVQIGYAFCPDGSRVQYPVPAGRYIGTNQQLINSYARQWGQQQAERLKVCLSSLRTTEFCLDQALSFDIRAASPTPSGAYSWSLISGSLPTGVTMPSGWVNGSKLTISGTPTTGGTFTFTIRCTSQTGMSATKSYTIKITGITTASPLPDGDVGTAYSETLAATAGATPPLSWQVTGGALPDGLTLDEETGEISGTPTVDGVFNFTITLQTEAT